MQQKSKSSKNTADSQARYKSLFETARYGILIIKCKDRIILDANPFIQRLLESSYEQLVGELIYDIGLFDNKNEAEGILSKVEVGREISYEKILDKKHNIKDIKIVASTYEENGEPVIQCNVLDVTERKRVQRDLFESRQRLEALMNALPVGVAFSSDVTCEYITGNPTLLRHLEINPGSNISASTHDRYAIGTKLQHYINGKKIDASELPMQRAIAENRVVGPIEIEVKLPSGKRWVMEAIGAPIRDAQGNVVAAVAVNADLTERKRAAEADKFELIVKQKRMKMDFIADATHELRTPLAIIKGNVDLALRSSTKGQNQLSTMIDAFKEIDQEVMHLANLLTDLTLLTTRGSEAQRTLATKNINIKQLLEKLAKRHCEFARKHQITVKINDVPDIFVSGDETYLERLFSNLITNGVLYGNENGTVTISGRKSKKEIQIDISDDGIGIPEKDIPHVFDRFFRSESSRSKNTGGSGLGLALVKWIAEAHGGKVSVKSTKKSGSTFTVTLPLLQ